MKIGQILFCDLWLPSTFIGECLSTANGLDRIVVRELFQNELMTNSNLKDEINGYFTRGEIVPAETVERLILKGIGLKQRFLLTGYPRTIEQFEGFMKLCSDNGITIDKLWYFKTDDFQGVFNDTIHFSKLQWSDNEIDEYKRKKLADHDDFRESIGMLLLSHEQLWHVIQLSKSEFLDKEQILKKIKNSAQHKL
jgi:adenylate kinase family enzyme